ncbi:UNVERIFIED_CONTAM: Aspartic proteinase-like protein 2 [Sesamum radiatum]|uniref:Aspartic proteinase-like protein 2 n=1 Tax=Sesamum radiatum TaxID=300843 RepID=A0AAW2W537_SESRA
MPPARILVVGAALFLSVAVGVVVGGEGEGKGLVLSLERVSHEGMGLSQLRHRDLVRHGRFLQQQTFGVVDFPVQGTYDPYLVGLYFTRVKLGTPPKEFYVQIDTGSDVLWVSCNPCTGCPTSSGLQIELEFFYPSSSSTASMISCNDQRCALGAQSSDSGCSGQNQCGYTFQYGDGSGTSGYYVSDSIYFDSIVGNSLTSNSSAPVVFGCSTSQSGDLTKPDRAVDGIFGFGQQGLSVISQLSSQGITPNSFSHCLKGENGGGGILVLGQIVEPNIVYTPLVPSQPHYNVNLQSISVNGQTLNIDSSVFATSGNRGTIIDSGTTLAYFAEEAYDPFVSAITQTVSQSVRPLLSKGNQCYLTTSSISEIFPPVSLNFAGGASMILRPQDYLLQQNSVGGAAVWCIGIQKIQGQGITILGDLVLKDKIVVYDLAGQRIGWANYDCSSSVNVSTTTNTGKTEFFNAGQVENNGSPHNELYKLIPITITAFLLHIPFFGILPFL